MRFLYVLLFLVACRVDEVEFISVSEADAATPNVTVGSADLQSSVDHVGVLPSAKPDAANDTFVLSVWNIHKRSDDVAQDQLSRLAKGADVLAIQEALHDTPLPAHFLGYHASSFRWSSLHAVNGVMTACLEAPLETQGLVSPAREMGFTTPKSALVSQHSLRNGQTLMLVNLHAMLTDVPASGFTDQLDQLVETCKDHEGPLVFCGDFNSWSLARGRRVRARMQFLGLQQVQLPDGVGTCIVPDGPFALFVGLDPTSELDHVFYRGLTVREAKWLPELDASDHVPIRVVFGIEATSGD
jgi:endonuclease/exonuclease/phosphatase (EEP) superfamily protein YafD